MLEDGVAVLVAELVVEVFEVVEVEHEEGEGASGVEGEGVERFVEEPAVGDAGEGIGFGEGSSVALGLAPGGADGVGHDGHGGAEKDDDRELDGGPVIERETDEGGVEDGNEGDGPVAAAGVAARVTNEGIQIDRPEGGVRIAEGEEASGDAGDVEHRDEEFDEVEGFGAGAKLRA